MDPQYIQHGVPLHRAASRCSMHDFWVGNCSKTCMMSMTFSPCLGYPIFIHEIKYNPSGRVCQGLNIGNSVLNSDRKGRLRLSAAFRDIGSKEKSEMKRIHRFLTVGIAIAAVLFCFNLGPAKAAEKVTFALDWVPIGKTRRFYGGFE